MRIPFFLLLSLLFSCAIAGAAEEPPATGPGAAFPFESRFVEVNGSRIHYVESGEGPTVLFLHGNPTSSYLWRNVIPHVAPQARAIAMDLIGFGRSDRPELDYRFQDHYRYVEGFIEALELQDIVLVIHDWGSMLGLEYARRHPDNVRALAMMEAIIPPAFPMESLAGMGAGADLFRRFRDPVQGPVLLQEENVFIEQLLGNATVTREMTEAEMEVYRAPFPTAASRFPIAVWPRELPIAGEPARNVDAVEAAGDWLRSSATPKLLLYANPGALVSPEDAAWMQAEYRNLEAVFVGPGRHYIQEDQPEAIGRNLAMWLRRESIVE
jgi:haloalkane dehalogenase